MSRVTLKMIAEKANTSIGTVDRALNNRSGVSEKSKLKVLRVAAELGYRPNKIASALGRKKPVVIGIAYPEEPRDFYVDITHGIDKAAEELQDYGVVVEKIRYRTHDPRLACEHLSAIDPARYNGIAINSSGAADVPIIDSLTNAGVPVITFNTDSPDSSRLFYVGSNSRQAGRMGGEMLDILLGGRGNITIVGNLAKIAPFDERYGGITEYLQSNSPGLRVYPCAECLSDPALAAKSLTDLLDRTPDIGGVFCTGYSSTIGAIAALKERNRRDISLVGFDLTARTSEALRGGWCRALIFQDPYKQGYQAVRLLARHILEGWSPQSPKLHTTAQLVLKTNIESFFSNQHI